MPNEHARIGVAGTAYYQVPGRNPASCPIRGSMRLGSDEEAYTRSPPKPLGAAWEPLKFEWIRTCSMLCVRNLEPSGGPAIEMQGGGGSLDLWIPAGMTTVIYPRGITLALRCPDGKAHYSLFAAPE